MDTTTLLLLVAAAGTYALVAGRDLLAPKRVRADQYDPNRVAEDDILTL